MLNFRKEVSLHKGDICVLNKKTEDHTLVWDGRRPEINDFNLFFVLEDNFCGNKKILQLIPIRFKIDANGFYYSNRFSKKSRWKATPLLAVVTDLSRAYNVAELMGTASRRSIVNRCAVLNSIFELSEDNQIEL